MLVKYFKFILKIKKLVIDLEFPIDILYFIQNIRIKYKLLGQLYFCA